MALELNGWTPARLDDLANEVRLLRMAMEKMQGERVKELERERDDALADVKSARSAPRNTFYAFAAPIVASAVTLIGSQVLFH